MVRIIIGFAITCLANAIGLLVANLVLDDMSVTASAFLIAMLIFTIATIILQPLVLKIALKNSVAKPLLGGTALVTTLVGLIVTAVITDGMHISGLSTWVVATVIVWFASMLAAILLPVFLVKKAVNNNGPNITTYGH
jgi:uncharacterized membrane protein YvlD (DUF360 family)